jgi:hypothetical protein
MEQQRQANNVEERKNKTKGKKRQKTERRADLNQKE